MARVDDQCAMWLNELKRPQAVPYRNDNSVLGSAISNQYVSNPYMSQQHAFHSMVPQHNPYAPTCEGLRSWHDTHPANSDAYSQSSTSHPSRPRGQYPCTPTNSFGDCIFFSNFPPEFPEEVIKSTFERYSRLAQLKVEYDNNGALLGMGFARFKTLSDTRKV